MSSACSARRRPHGHAGAWARAATRRCASRTSANRHFGCGATLNARAVHQTELPTGTAPSTLAQLYDPITMPANLAKAHAALDKAVDAAYKEDGGSSSYANDGERVAFLFKRYAALTSLI
jgi:hypothetical protein